MSSFCGLIYAEARISAGYTQETAAHLIGIGERSLSDYERGKTYCPEATVIRMIEIYQAEWLGWAHLQRNNLVGARCLPIYEQKDAAQALLIVQRESRHVDHVMPELVDICSDGKVTFEERHAFSVAAKEIRDLVGAAFNLLFTPMHKERTDCVGAQKVLLEKKISTCS